MTVNNFMASGGDDYAPFSDVLDATNTGLIDSDVFASHLESLPNPLHYEVQCRIAQLGPWPEEDGE